MKLWSIVRFELGYQLRRAWPWLMLTALGVFAFFVQRDNSLANALYEDIAANSPFNIVKTTVIATVIWLLASATIAGDAAARDVSTRMYSLVYTSPIREAEYAGGRFIAALSINSLLLLGVQVAIVVAIYLPGGDATLIAPFRLASHLTAYLCVALPTALAGTAIQFAFALRSGRSTTAYFGSVLLLFTSFFIASVVLYGKKFGSDLDPIGMRLVIEDVAHRWTVAQRNTRLVVQDPVIMRNRIVWSLIGLGVLALTLLRFRFAHRVERTSLWKRFTRGSRSRVAAAAPNTPKYRVPFFVPKSPRSFGAVARLRCVIAIARGSFGAAAKSWAGAFMLGVIPVLATLIIVSQMTALGVPLVPATGQVIKEITGPLALEVSRWVIVPLLTIFFAGEIVWRERDARLNEIDDATPVPEWVPLAGKLLGLGMVLATFVTLLSLAGIAAQTILGYHHYELALYAKVMLGFQLTDYVLFAVLAFAIHVVVNQKYVGYLVAVVAFGLIVLAPMFGVDHNLLIYDAGPWFTYTDMRGLAPFVWPWLWFKLYWAAWASALAVVARLLWVRGRESGLDARLRLARSRFAGQTAAAAATAGALVLALGGFIFYNTNILNDHLAADSLAEQKAQYERRYGRLADVAQPSVAHADLKVDILPEQGVADIAGTYRLVNEAGAPIDSIQLDLPRGTDSLGFNRPATRVVDDRELHHSIFALAQPLQPGDSVDLTFRVRVARRGFRDQGADVSITRNVSLFTNAWLPSIGYQRTRELLAPSDRRKHGLPGRAVIPSVYDTTARKRVERGSSLDVTMSTSGDQTAVAPGELRRSWTAGGRNYFQYSTNAPIGNEWTFASARYVAQDVRWKGVAIRILHHPAHTRHVGRMLDGIKAALGYYTQLFGPYRYGQLTVLEVPGNGVGIHADASMLTHGEGITLLDPQPGHLDLSYAVAGHEMGHEWNIPAAYVEGAPVMSESIAEYESIDLVGHTKGLAEQRRLLEFLRGPYPYPPIHRGEPLLRGLDPYMSYRKGPFTLHLLGEYIGEDAVNGVLRKLWQMHTAPGAPLATTLDLYRELQAVAPDSLRPLLHDLFEVNTTWTFGADQPTAVQNADGTWRVTIPVRARKAVADSAGVETIVPLREAVQIGVFAEGEKGDKLANALYLERRQVPAGASTITVTVARKPVLAGIDPFHVLDWEQGEEDDNVRTVVVRGAGSS